MPRYDYRCGKGDVIEAVREMSVTKIVCPSCGGVAQRQAVYAYQIIRGETVAKPNGQRLPNRCRDRNGRYDLKLVEEAQHEMIYDADKGGIEAPDLFKQAKTREKIRGRARAKTATG